MSGQTVIHSGFGWEGSPAFFSGIQFNNIGHVIFFFPVYFCATAGQPRQLASILSSLPSSSHRPPFKPQQATMLTEEMVVLFVIPFYLVALYPSSYWLITAPPGET